MCLLFRKGAERGRSEIEVAVYQYENGKIEVFVNGKTAEPIKNYKINDTVKFTVYNIDKENGAN